MSVLIAYLLGDGVIFAADRNITQTTSATTIQIEGRKILKWPGDDALIDYVGKARVGGRMMDEWLDEFVSRHLDVSVPRIVAKALQTEIQAAMSAEPVGPSIIQFAAFGEREGAGSRNTGISLMCTGWTIS